MFSYKKLIIISLLILTLFMGAVNAANETSTEPVAANDDAGLNNELKTIDDTQSSIWSSEMYDASNESEVLGVSAEDNTALSSSSDNNEDLVCATDHDALGATKSFSGTTFQALNSFISSCANGDTINLLNDIKRESSFTDYIYVGKSVTINGNGHTIDCSDKLGFKIDAGATLNNIRFINSQPAIRMEYADSFKAIVKNCIFDSSTVEYNSGILYY